MGQFTLRIWPIVTVQFYKINYMNTLISNEKKILKMCKAGLKDRKKKLTLSFQEEYFYRICAFYRF